MTNCIGCAKKCAQLVQVDSDPLSNSSSFHRFLNSMPAATLLMSIQPLGKITCFALIWLALALHSTAILNSCESYLSKNSKKKKRGIFLVQAHWLTQYKYLCVLQLATQLCISFYVKHFFENIRLHCLVFKVFIYICYINCGSTGFRVLWLLYFEIVRIYLIELVFLSSILIILLIFKFTLRNPAIIY